MTTLAHPWQSDADRAADAILSVRNDQDIAMQSPILAALTSQFDSFFGVNAQADAQPRSVQFAPPVHFEASHCRYPARNGQEQASTLDKPEISAGHPTHPQRTDAQPTAGGIPSPANPYQRAGVAGSR